MINRPYLRRNDLYRRWKDPTPTFHRTTNSITIERLARNKKNTARSFRALSFLSLQSIRFSIFDGIYKIENLFLFNRLPGRSNTYRSTFSTEKRRLGLVWNQCSLPPPYTIGTICFVEAKHDSMYTSENREIIIRCEFERKETFRFVRCWPIIHE